MRRVVGAFGLVLALGGIVILGIEAWRNGAAHPAHLYVPAGLSAFGLIVGALMADPKTVLEFLKSAAAFKWGRRESDTEGTPPSGGGGQ